jgi:hypothetical protein
MAASTIGLMGKRRARAWAGFALLLVAGCDSAQSPSDETATAILPPVEASPGPVDEATPGSPSAEIANQQAGGPGLPGPRSTGSSRYVSLEPSSCKVVEQNTEEGGYWRRRCAGSAGYSLETSESDLRQDVVIIAPDGRRSELNLSSLVAKGAFNSLGKMAEWRGQDPGKPRALIVRLSVPADTDLGRRGSSDLVVARLAPSACVVAVVPQGPGQNEKARAIADGELPPCKAGQ